MAAGKRFHPLLDLVADERNGDALESGLGFRAPENLLLRQGVSGRLVAASRVLLQVVTKGRIGAAATAPAELVELTPASASLELLHVTQLL